MNKSYRLIWSHHQQSMIVVGEHTRGRGKQGGKAKTLAAAVATALLTLSGSAQAACSAGPNTYSCSGAETSTRTLSGTPLSVTLDPTFSMNAAAGNGLNLGGTNGLTLTQAANGGTIASNSAGSDAVSATNSASGDIDITTTGDVSGVHRGIFSHQTGSGNTVINTVGGTVSSTEFLSTEDAAISAWQGSSAGNLTITTSGISGARNGILSVHEGAGSTSITTTDGQVVGSSYYGIYASNRYSTSTAMTITTADVTGGRIGIQAFNSGSGTTTIDTTAGQITGVGVHGIDVQLFDYGLTSDLILRSANVSGGQRGIDVDQHTAASVTIDTTFGSGAGVTGTTGDGIHVVMRDAASTGLNITTRDVNGGQNGIWANQNGIGDVAIDTMAGSVTGTAANGIQAQITNSGGGGMTITTAEVSGGQNGISATQNGIGKLEVTTSGLVNATNGHGILAYISNSASAADLSITTASVSAGQHGIYTWHYGTGKMDIDTTAGSVTAGSQGIAAFMMNGASTADLTITTDDVSSNSIGINTWHYGSGATFIDTTRGSVVSLNRNGIDTGSGAGGTDLVVTVASVSGGADDYGILATNGGTGRTAITVATGGVVHGGTAGISATHASANPFTITIDGTVQNTSGLGSALAITATSTGSGLLLQNNSNTIIGTVNLTAAADTFNNVGSWFTENGTSDFGGGNDVLNNTGLIRAANNAALAETTRFNNLELFNHSGIATLQDGAVGDRLITSGNFVGNNGEVRLDTVLDTGTGGSDVLEINGNASGNTRLRIANAGGAGGQTTGDGIQVVQVNGTSTANAFSLAAPVKAGIWNYTLDFGGANNANQNWYLVSQRLNEVGAIYESTPRILIDMLNPISTLQQRVGQRLVYGEDAREGAWMRAIGEWRDTELRHSTAGSRWDADSSTLQLGYDRIVSETVKGEWALGLTAHYNRMDADIKNPSGRGSLDSEGYGAGLTATWYGNQGSYVDLQAAISCTSTDFASQDLGTLAKNRHGQIYTLSAEAGHRISLNETQTLIPQLQLQTKRLRSDNFTDQLGSRVDLGNESVTEARLGVAWELSTKKQDRLYLIGNLLHDFNPETRVMVDGMRLDVKTASTAAEIGFGGTVSVAQNTVLYGEGKYRRDLGSSDSDAYGLTTGLRWSW